MWAIAASSESTTLMLMILARYSSDQSASLAATSFAPATPRSAGERRGVAAHLDALWRENAPISGRKRAATVGVDEQRLGGVARAHLLRLGVVDDAAPPSARSASAST
jgi:hypothetical protein